MTLNSKHDNYFNIRIYLEMNIRNLNKFEITKNLNSDSALLFKVALRSSFVADIQGRQLKFCVKFPHNNDHNLLNL